MVAQHAIAQSSTTRETVLGPLLPISRAAAGYKRLRVLLHLFDSGDCSI